MGEGGGWGGRRRNPQQTNKTQQCSVELGRHVLNSDYTLKNFALWSHKCPHVQSLCVCIYTCKHKLTWRVNIVGSLLYRLQQRYLFKIALWHTAVCIYVYMCIHTRIHIYTYVLYKSLDWFRTKKIDVNEKFSHWKTILNGILLFYKSKVWDFFPLVYIHLFPFFLFPSVKTLKILIQMRELGFFFLTWN